MLPERLDLRQLRPPGVRLLVPEAGQPAAGRHGIARLPVLVAAERFDLGLRHARQHGILRPRINRYVVLDVDVDELVDDDVVVDDVDELVVVLDVDEEVVVLLLVVVDEVELDVLVLLEVLVLDVELEVVVDEVELLVVVEDVEVEELVVVLEVLVVVAPAPSKVNDASSYWFVTSY